VPRIYSLRKEAQKRDPIPPDAVYVGRGGGSPWGNPFEAENESQRRWACDAFEEYGRMRAEADPNWLRPLIGKDLVCWCQSPSDKRKKRCHAETLLRLVEEYGDEGRADG
jgi:Domain of unknown function (DUF4326)